MLWPTSTGWQVACPACVRSRQVHAISEEAAAQEVASAQGSGCIQVAFLTAGWMYTWVLRTNRDWPGGSTIAWPAGLKACAGESPVILDGSVVKLRAGDLVDSPLPCELPVPKRRVLQLSLLEMRTWEP